MLVVTAVDKMGLPIVYDEAWNETPEERAFSGGIFTTYR